MVLLMAPAISGSVDNQPFSPYVESFENGWIDWDKGLIYGVGKAYLHSNRNIKARTKRAAGLIAFGHILKMAAGVNLDDQRMLKSLGPEEITIQLKAIIKAKDHSSKFIEMVGQDHFEVIKVASMKGVDGLSSKIIRNMKETPWREIPIKSKKQSLDDDNEPWLILDARKLSLNNRVEPALFPKIITTSGETIYSLGKVEENAVTERGMARYVVSETPANQFNPDSKPIVNLLGQIDALLSVQEAHARQIERRKKRRNFIVKEIKEAGGLAKTNLIISETDARLLKAEDSSSKILKKCRVVVVVSTQNIGGIEGMLKLMPAYAMLSMEGKYSASAHRKAISTLHIQGVLLSVPLTSL